MGTGLEIGVVRDGRTLVDAVADGLRRAVARGALPPGATLPPRSALARTLGVGECTVRGAVRLLAREGVLDVRRRVGATVAKTPKSAGRRRVLDVSTEDSACYAASAVGVEMQNALHGAGFAYAGLAMRSGADDRLRAGLLRAALEQRPDFVVLRSASSLMRAAARALAERQIPYATVFGSPLKMGRCVGNVNYDASGAIADFTADCRRAGILSVAQMDLGTDTYCDASAALEASGVSVERISLKVKSCYPGLDEHVADAYAAMARRLSQGPLPDLLFVSDDFLAQGAIAALLNHGVRIPGDLRVVAYANRGSGFFFAPSLACVEFDPRADGAEIAKCVETWFATGSFPAYSSRPVYRRGMSFPIPSARNGIHAPAVLPFPIRFGKMAAKPPKGGL